MRRVTNCVDLAHVLSDLTGVGVSGVQARAVMHARGWTRYERLGPEEFGLLAEDVLAEPEPERAPWPPVDDRPEHA